MSKTTQFHVLISGLVQGVGFRYAAKQKADELGVNGWVKNLPDGRVEMVIEAPKQTIEKILDWCYSDSPGRVETIERREAELEAIHGFYIRL